MIYSKHNGNEQLSTFNIGEAVNNWWLEEAERLKEFGGAGEELTTRSTEEMGGKNI